MDIILDTNFLMIPGEHKVDIFTEIERTVSFKYQLCVLDKTVDELNRIRETQKGKYRQYAKIGLQLLKLKNVKVIKTETLKNVDELIVEIAKKGQTAVATQDLGLKNALKQENIPVLVLRQKKHIIFA